MKKHALIILFLLAFLSANAQSANEKSEVLKHCTDLVELQPYFQINGNNLQQLFVMDCCNKFDDVSGLSKFGNPLIFVDKKGVVDGGIDAYLQFYIFEINVDNARLDFKLIRKNADPKIVQVKLELVKQNNIWVLLESKIEEK